MRKILLPISFFALAPLIIFLSIVQFAYLSSVENGNNMLSFFQNNKNQNIAYAALPTNVNDMSGTIGVEDNRVAKLTSFFQKYGSILENYSQQFVDVADQNDLDYRLLPAVAMQESQGCKKIPADSNNCWGYGITKSQTMKFPNIETAINTISKSLGKYYSSNGLITVDQIGTKWNPTNQNNWTDKVKYFMDQI